MNKKIALTIGLVVSVPLIFISKGYISARLTKTHLDTQKVSTTSSNPTDNTKKNNTTTNNTTVSNTTTNNTTKSNTTTNNTTINNTTTNNNTTNNSTADIGATLYTNKSATVYRKIGNGGDNTLQRWTEVKKLATSGNYTYIDWHGDKFYIETKYLTSSIPQSTNRSKWVYTWDKLKSQLSKNTFGGKLLENENGTFIYNPFYPQWGKNTNHEFNLFFVAQPNPESTAEWDFSLVIEHFSDDNYYGSIKDFDETTKAIFEMIFPGKGLEFDAKLSDVLDGKGKTLGKEITVKWIDYYNSDLTFGLPEVFAFEERKISVEWSPGHPIYINFYPINYDENITKILYDADERLAHVDIDIVKKYFPDAK